MSTISSPASAASAGTFKIGGSLPVHRLGFGAMRITGPGIWGEPKDPAEARAVLRKLPDLGINFIDTADSYGPEVSELLIAEVLHPYRSGLVIATKAGLTRQGPDKWAPVGRPEYLRQCLEMSLRRLRVDTIDLYQLHRIDAKVPLEDQIGEMKRFQEEGKIRYFGLSEVSVEQIEQCAKHIEISTVQNLFNLTNRKSEVVLEYCHKNGIGFIPWFPVSNGELARPGGVLDEMAKSHSASPAQLALAWLLHRSPVMLPIPGTSSVEHLVENTAAAGLQLREDEFSTLSSLG